MPECPITPAASARPLPPPEADAGKFLAVKIGDRSYALAAGRLLGVVRLPASGCATDSACPTPGLVSFGGRLLPRLDLREKFGLPFDRTDDTRVIVVQTELRSGRSRQMGLVVDRVEGLASFTADEIAAVTGAGEARPTDFLLSIIRTATGVKLLPELNLAVMAEVAEMMRGS